MINISCSFLCKARERISLACRGERACLAQLLSKVCSDTCAGWLANALLPAHQHRSDHSSFRNSPSTCQSHEFAAFLLALVYLKSRLSNSARSRQLTASIAKSDSDLPVFLSLIFPSLSHNLLKMFQGCTREQRTISQGNVLVSVP